ncbi:MAG: transporter substrate-binding domain-containing protein [Pseudochelatococcus sp.]|uniref:transporter substrate-binding domain-containing protein n=1 Tax=Pseudochelatococcus sp. TaxID=2020869 RepID=UPI003D8F0AB3
MITRRDLNRLIAAGAAGLTAGGIPLAGTAAPAAGASLERIRASGKLRIGGVADGAPYYKKDLLGGKWRGFYIDICQALADDLGVRLDIAETTWGNSVLDLQTNKIDVFFGLNPTPERQAVIDFSGPVFKNAFTFITRKGFEPKTWEDLNKPEVRIAVDIGSSHDAAVTRHLPKATITRLKHASDATVALQSGRVDAQCLVLVLSLTVLKANPAIGTLIVPTPVDATTSNAGFRREEETSWRDFVTKWIEDRRASGFIHKAVVSNMELVGVSEADLPPGISL